MQINVWCLVCQRCAAVTCVTYYNIGATAGCPELREQPTRHINYNCKTDKL